MKKIKAILFDLDNTLGDSHNYIINCHKINIDENIKGKLTSKQRQELLELLVDYSYHRNIKRNEFYKMIEQKYNVKVTKHFYNQKVWAEYARKYYKMYPDTKDTLKELKQRGYKIGLVSNSHYPIQYIKLRTTRIMKYFDAVAISGEIGLAKPNKEIFEYILKKLKVKNDETIFVGDSYEMDVKGAINANIIPIWFKGNKNNKVKVINSLNELLEILN